MKVSSYFGRGDRNRTHIYGFGDRYTNRCTTPLSGVSAKIIIAYFWRMREFWVLSWGWRRVFGDLAGCG